MTNDDLELVALIDNELDGGRRSRLLARLKEDIALRERYEALRDAGAPIRAGFDSLLGRAPNARLRDAIPAESFPRATPQRLGGIAFRELAAGIVIGLLAAGAAAWVALTHAPPRDEQEDWRSAVVEYMELYTNETFALANPDPEFQAKKLSAVSERVGATLTPENVSLPGLRFKSAHILSYEGAPLGEIAYVDSQGAPVLFCVIANGGADSPTRLERRGELSLSSWSHDGRGYLVIGRLPEERVAALAQTLEKRFGNWID